MGGKNIYLEKTIFLKSYNFFALVILFFWKLYDLI
jgi:hypothetical protein